MMKIIRRYMCELGNPTNAMMVLTSARTKYSRWVTLSSIEPFNPLRCHESRIPFLFILKSYGDVGVLSDIPADAYKIDDISNYKEHKIVWHKKMIKSIMLRFITILAILAICQPSVAGISFKFTPGSASDVSTNLRATMESNVSALLTEIHSAGTAKRSLNFTGISIEPVATQRLSHLWQSVHMTCNFSNNVKDCLHDVQGFQVRDIYITVLPQDDTYNQNRQRALTISLDRNGKITGVRLALESQADANTIMAGNGQAIDAKRRRELLKWVEDFCSYYDEKNLEAIDQIFSEGTLIITGSMVQTQKNEIQIYDGAKMRFAVQEKEQYMHNLAHCFNINDVIKLKFEHISVTMSGKNTDIYGVRLKQTWNSSTYNDEGWLFLLWDFYDEDHPQILVRTWQPYKHDDGTYVSEDEVFSLDDFLTFLTL